MHHPLKKKIKKSPRREAIFFLFFFLWTSVMLKTFPPGKIPSIFFLTTIFFALKLVVKIFVSRIGKKNYS